MPASSVTTARRAKSARPRGIRKHGQKIVEERFPRELRRLVQGLNMWGSQKGEKPITEWEEGWREVESIVRSVSPLPFGVVPRRSIKRFNELARGAPIVLELVWGSKVTIPMTSHPGPSSYALSILWHSLQSPGIKRVKRCPRCKTWFLDRTRNRGALRCSIACTWAWWNRRRRKQARHSQYRA
jgi:hypothetical protein